MKTYPNKYIILIFMAGLVHLTIYSQAELYNSVELINNLEKGMTYGEVKKILGTPDETKTDSNQWIVRWNLHKNWDGFIPYDLIFNKTNKELLSWQENNKIYTDREQKLDKVIEKLDSMSESNPKIKNYRSASFENNIELMQIFAGYYYRSGIENKYHNNNVLKILLYPNGKYQMRVENGNSNHTKKYKTSSDIFGTWKITGNAYSGTIETIDNSGKSTILSYKRCTSDSILLGKTKFAHKRVKQ